MNDLNLGQHCHLLSCRTLDFLPLQCPHCTYSFCSSHSSTSSHHCPSAPNNTTNDLGTFDERFTHLLPTAESRNSVRTQRASEAIERAQKRSAAQAVLEKNFGTLSGGAGAGGGTEKKAKSAMIELMRLKQRAKQGDPRKGGGEVQMDQRLYVTVVLVQKDGKGEREMRELWIPKVTTVGKALDLFAMHLKVENINHTTTDLAKKLSLYLPDGPLLDNGERLDKDVVNGGIVWLVRGEWS